MDVGVSFQVDWKCANITVFMAVHSQCVMHVGDQVTNDNKQLKEKLFSEIVQYSKPAILWEEFNTLFVPLRLTKTI